MEERINTDYMERTHPNATLNPITLLAASISASKKNGNRFETYDPLIDLDYNLD